MDRTEMKKRGIDNDLHSALIHLIAPFNVDNIEQVLAVSEGERDSRSWGWVLKMHEAADLRDTPHYRAVVASSAYSGFDVGGSMTSIILLGDIKSPKNIDELTQFFDTHLWADQKLDLLRQVQTNVKAVTWREMKDLEMLPTDDDVQKRIDDLESLLRSIVRRHLVIKREHIHRPKDEENEILMEKAQKMVELDSLFHLGDKVKVIGVGVPILTANKTGIVIDVIYQGDDYHTSTLSEDSFLYTLDIEDHAFYYFTSQSLQLIPVIKQDMRVYRTADPGVRGTVLFVMTDNHGPETILVDWDNGMQRSFVDPNKLTIIPPTAQ